MDKENMAKKLIQMEMAALDEWYKGNPDNYLAIYAEDVTYFDPALEKRMDGIQKLREYYEGARGKSKVERYELIDPVVQVSDTMAVLSYNLLYYIGEDIHKWNCTEVYQLDNSGKWKIIHNHWSLTQSMPL